MPQSGLLRALFLFDNPILVRRILMNRRKKRVGIHNLNRGRAEKGEFHVLFYQLRNNPSRFFQFLRMSVGTFDYILNKIKDRIGKKTAHFKEPISSVERLYITLR